MFNRDDLVLLGGKPLVATVDIRHLIEGYKLITPLLIKAEYNKLETEVFSEEFANNNKIMFKHNSDVDNVSVLLIKQILDSIIGTGLPSNYRKLYYPLGNLQTIGTPLYIVENLIKFILDKCKLDELTLDEKNILYSRLHDLIGDTYSIIPDKFMDKVGENIIHVCYIKDNLIFVDIGPWQKVELIWLVNTSLSSDYFYRYNNEVNISLVGQMKNGADIQAVSDTLKEFDNVDAMYFSDIDDVIHQVVDMFIKNIRMV